MKTRSTPAESGPGPQISPPVHRSGRRWSLARLTVWSLLPLRMQLGLLMGTVAALAVAIPTVLHAIVLLDDLEQTVSAQNGELARAVGSLAEQRLSQTILALELIASSPSFADDVDRRDVARLRTRLANGVRLDPDLSSITVVDRQGVVWAHTLPDDRILSADNPYAPGVQAALTSGQPTVGQAFRSVVTGRAVVRVIVPFHGRDGTVAGALQGMLSLERLGQLVERARGGGLGTVALYDATGRLLSGSDTSLILTDVTETNSPVLRALRGETVSRATVELDGHLAYASTQPLAHGWVVLAYQPVEAARGSLDELFARDGQFALAAFVLAMLVGILAAQCVTEPLLVLLGALRSLRNKQHTLPLPASSSAEHRW
jgi:hypothetical protein